MYALGFPDLHLLASTIPLSRYQFMIAQGTSKWPKGLRKITHHNEIPSQVDDICDELGREIKDCRGSLQAMRMPYDIRTKEAHCELTDTSTRIHLRRELRHINFYLYSGRSRSK